MQKHCRPPESHPEDDLIPCSKGTYALLLHLPVSTSISIPRFGATAFAQGMYVYVGSAFGLGGIRARVGRHLRPSRKQHWHIDWLLPHMRVSGFWFSTAPIHMECIWCQLLSRLDGATIPVRGFGSSDCHAGCPAHLIALGTSSIDSISRVLELTQTDSHGLVRNQNFKALPMQDLGMPVHVARARYQ